MNDFLQTELARPSEDPDTTVKATWYMVREGHADLLPMLGLGSPELLARLGIEHTPPRAMNLPKGTKHLGQHERATVAAEIRDGKTYCAQCMRRTQADGRCRRAGCGGAR